MTQGTCQPPTCGFICCVAVIAAIDSQAVQTWWVTVSSRLGEFHMHSPQVKISKAAGCLLAINLIFCRTPLVLIK